MDEIQTYEWGNPEIIWPQAKKHSSNFQIPRKIHVQKFALRNSIEGIEKISLLIKKWGFYILDFFSFTIFKQLIMQFSDSEGNLQQKHVLYVLNL